MEKQIPEYQGHGELGIGTMGLPVGYGSEGPFFHADTLCQKVAAAQVSLVVDLPRVFLRKRPLQPVVGQDPVADTRVERDRSGYLVEDFRRIEVLHPLLTAGNAEFREYPPVGHRLANTIYRLARSLHAPFHTRQSAVLFSHGPGGENNIGKFCGIGQEQLLDHQELHLFQGLFHILTTRESGHRIDTGEVEGLQFPSRSGLHHPVGA